MSVQRAALHDRDVPAQQRTNIDQGASAENVVQMMPITILGQHLGLEDDLETDTDALTVEEARAVLANRASYSKEQVKAARTHVKLRFDDVVGFASIDTGTTSIVPGKSRKLKKGSKAKPRKAVYADTETRRLDPRDRETLMAVREDPLATWEAARWARQHGGYSKFRAITRQNTKKNKKIEPPDPADTPEHEFSDGFPSSESMDGALADSDESSNPRPALEEGKKSTFSSLLTRAKDALRRKK